MQHNLSFSDILASEHSRRATDIILSEINRDPKRMDDLMDCFFSENLRICQRAAWPVGDVGEKHPSLILPYLPKLIANLHAPKHDAIIRNTVRTWQFMPIPEAFQGEIFGLCFNYLGDPKIPIAIRAFSMTVCANICKEVPDLMDELILAIEDQLENGSSGIRNRGQKIISLLKIL
ncbi:MAG: hypothetical protein IPL08_11030 [Saprospiraceae bacterium]|nr:hypothetical protein [Saprospiraceae bacterium]